MDEESIHLTPRVVRCVVFICLLWPSLLIRVVSSLLVFTCEWGNREGLHDCLINPSSPKGGGESDGLMGTFYVFPNGGVCLCLGNMCGLGRRAPTSPLS
jgi:hypothetical protein